MGPLINAAARERCERYVALAEEHGGKVAFGGGRPAGLERGYYFEPTVLDLPDNANPAAQDEIFGPVLGVIGYDDVDDAVRIANDSPYGLSAQVYGADVAAATAVARRLRTGAVNVNTSLFSAYAPGGGYKQSGLGRERGPEGIREFQEVKHMAIGELKMSDDGHAQPRLADLGRRPHPRAAPPVGRPRRRPRTATGRRTWRSRDGIEYWVYDGKRYPELGPERGRRQDQGGVQPRAAPVLRDAPGLLRLRRPASRTWTAPASSPRSASRRSPGSAASCSWRPSDREFGLECLQDLQRLARRGVVRRRARPLHPADADPDVGPARSPPRRWSAWPTGASPPSPSPRTRRRSACRRSTTRTATGTR